MGQNIICVTGASGLIGREIVHKLRNKENEIRVLSRKPMKTSEGVHLFQGDLLDISQLKTFLSGADYLYHCAGEKKQSELMSKVNIEGTQNIFNVAIKSKLKYFCHISSAGVVGKTNQKLIKEEIACNPQNEYERTKYEAEKIVNRIIPNCSTVILRPINVIDDANPGVFTLPIRNSVKDKLHVFIKGSENAHLVHAQQVAECAIFFMKHEFKKPEIFFVGNEEDPNNTVKGIWNSYYDLMGERKQKINNSLPVIIPHLLRKIRGVNANRGDVKYSLQKLQQYGFKNNWNINRITEMIVKRTI
jgi:nucleoside-diphosphate-sugar epimerase